MRHTLTLAICLLVPAVSRADEFYFATIFGSQKVLNDPSHTHSFATFVKATGCGPDWSKYRLEAVTISWLPVTMTVHAQRWRPEPGHNFGLIETLDWAVADGQRISQWGPYQVKRELYDGAVQRAAELESGRVKYFASDLWRVREDVSNCIYGVLGSTGKHDSLGVGTLGFGEWASRFICMRFKHYLIDPDTEHLWLNERLEISNYPLVPRKCPRLPRAGG